MAVARTGSPTGVHRTGSHSSAFSVTIPGDADCVVLDLMATHFTTCQGATGVTCDGVAMTLVSGTDAGSMAFGAPCRHQSWVIIAPNTGTVNITPTFGGTGGVSRSHLAVQFYTGVDQTTPTEGGYASGRITSPTGGTKTFAPTTTTVADDYLICGYHNFGSGVGDIDADGVDIYESYDSNNGTIFGTADKLLTGSGQNMGWTDTETYDYAGHVFVLKAAAAGGAFSIDAQAGSFALAGINASLLRSKVVDAQVGAFTLAGVNANLIKGRVLDCNTGTFALAGQNADLLKSKLILSVAGAFSLAGQNADLEYVPAPSDFSIDALPGAFVLTGISATILKSKAIDANAGAFTLTGVNATLARGRALDANAGAFALSGVDASLLKSKSIDAVAGAFTMTGRIALLEYSGAPEVDNNPMKPVSILVYSQLGAK